jgi:hypothetical protein
VTQYGLCDDPVFGVPSPNLKDHAADGALDSFRAAARDYLYAAARPHRRGKIVLDIDSRL